MRGGTPALLIVLLVSAGQAPAEKADYRVFEGAGLAQGRATWLEHCEGCHGYGIAGAPIPMHPEEWRTRVRQDRETLYRHAIEGFYGPDDTVMPARGGNEDLTDRQVKQAVDYMAALAISYIQATEKSR